MPHTPRDEFVDRLNRRYGGNRSIDFTSATDQVVGGFELETSGNRSYGSNVYIATGARFQLEPEERLLGRSIAIGTVESYPACELRCSRKDDAVIVALYADGAPISRQLTCPADDHQTDYDEGLLAWLGPVESYCTPWSDNDPDHCQVITVARLRQFAASYTDKHG